MKKNIFLIALICVSYSVFSQKYEIKLKINGLKDTIIYLGHHFGDKKYVVDTAKVDSKGNAVFSKDKVLERGIYLVVMPSRGNSYFEILIGKDSQKFSIETDTTDYLKRTVKGSPENQIFNDYQKKMSEMQVVLNDLNSKYIEAQKKNEDLTELRGKFQSWTDERDKFVNSIVEKHPKTFFAAIINAMKEVKFPEVPKNPNGEAIDQNFLYHYNTKHFWDNVDFSESGLLRTPIYESKINYYLSPRNLIPMPDTLIKEANKLIRRAYDGGDTLMFKYTCSHLLSMFDTSKIMGYDAVMCAIAEEWYLSGRAFWADTSLLRKISERVEKITPNKIGSVAYNMQRMQGADDKYYSLHNVQAEYTVLIFFEPSCGHCKKEVPKLRNAYSDTLKNLGVKIFAVFTQYDKNEWIEFLQKEHLMDINGWINVWDGPYPHSNFRNYYDIYSTPVIFVLDKDKKIIAKRLGVEQIKSFLKQDKIIKELEKKK